MALWPFRRKSGRKRSRSGAALSDAEGPPARSQTEGAVTRPASKKKQRTEPAKLQRRARTYSFSPGRQDELGVGQRRPSLGRPGPSTRRRDDNELPGEPAWDRTPTLHHKQSNQRPMRRKTSKQQKRDDRTRAAEIKAMSNFAPVRPATNASTAGRPMKSDSQRVKTTVGFGGDPASDVSLPIAASIHSSLSSNSDPAAFKVSALDSLAPRPTLRYAAGSRWTPSRASAPARSASQRRGLAEKVPVAEEALKEHRRVDDLADGLDASDLRALMEREDRRRQLKRQREQERAERRLGRKAEKQKAEMDEARESGTPPPENLERGVAGRELVGLGIDPASAVVTSSSQERISGASDPVPNTDGDGDADNEQLTKAPQGSSHQAGSDPTEESTAPQAVGFDEVPDQTKPQEQTTSLAHTSRLTGILKSKKSQSKSTLVSDKELPTPPEVINEEGVPRKTSWNSEKRGRFSLTSFLRWGGKSRRSSGGPPSFSNTSREEMQAAAAAQTPAQALAKLQGEDLSSTPETPAGTYVSRKPSASAPMRTKSRFREDLPDFPMSPPESRQQSPEVDPPELALDEASDEMRTQPIPIPTPKHIPSYRRTPTSVSPEPQPMSLASIDSEGSWLSGKVGPRRTAIHNSIARANRLEQSQTSDSPTSSTQEDLAITDDDYLARLAPHRNSGILAGVRRSEDGRPSSDEDDFARESSAKWGAVGALPQVVHAHKHDRSTMRSHEGLLNIESGDEETSP